MAENILWILVEGGQIQHISAIDPTVVDRVVLVDRDKYELQYYPDYPLTEIAEKDVVKWEKELREELNYDKI